MISPDTEKWGANIQTRFKRPGEKNSRFFCDVLKERGCKITGEAPRLRPCCNCRVALNCDINSSTVVSTVVYRGGRNQPSTLVWRSSQSLWTKRNLLFFLSAHKRKADDFFFKKDKKKLNSPQMICFTCMQPGNSAYNQKPKILPFSFTCRFVLVKITQFPTDSRTLEAVSAGENVISLWCHINDRTRRV